MERKRIIMMLLVLPQVKSQKEVRKLERRELDFIKKKALMNQLRK